MYGEAATWKAMCVPLVTTVHHNCIYRTIDTRRLWLFFLLAKMLLGVMKHVAAETAAIFKMESCRRQAARLRLLSKVTNFTVHRRLCGKLLARCAEWNKITVAVIIDVIYYFAALCCLQLIYIQASRKIQWYFPQSGHGPNEGLKCWISGLDLTGGSRKKNAPIQCPCCSSCVGCVSSRFSTKTLALSTW